MNATTSTIFTNGDEGDIRTTVTGAFLAAAFVLALASPAPETHLPDGQGFDAQADCRTKSDVVSHQARSRNGVSLSCTDEMLARVSR